MGQCGFLDLEPLLVGRLRERVPEGGAVKVSGDFAVVGAADNYPALHVVLPRYRVLEHNGVADARVGQVWHVATVTRDASESDPAGDVRGEHSRLVQAVIDVLNGWRYAEDRLPLVLDTPVFAPSVRDGILYFPLAFTARLTVGGNITGE